MTGTEYARLTAALADLRMRVTHHGRNGWCAEIAGIEVPAGYGSEHWGSTPETAMKNAMKQLRWLLRDVPATAGEVGR